MSQNNQTGSFRPIADSAINESRAKLIFAMKKKSEATALFIALFMFPLSFFYTGRIGKGIILFFACYLFITIPFIWLYAICVACKDTREHNELLKLELGL